MQTNHYDEHLGRNEANFVPLSPVSFIARTAAVYPERAAIVYGSRSYSWRDCYLRCARLAAALKRRGIGRGDTVAVMAANTPEMLEAHFGVPMAGAVLNTLNTRLDARTIAFMLGHAGARVLITDTEFAPLVQAALALMDDKPLVIDIDDAQGPGGQRLGSIDYEAFIAEAFIAASAQQADVHEPHDEWQAICLNYTSGTTGNPKGVVYHHRGAYLTAVSNMIDWQMARHAVFLWTLPLFHCNGWGFAWTIALNAGTSICMRRFDADAVLDAIAEHRVTHYCGAPTIHAMLAEAAQRQGRRFEHPVNALIGGAPAPLPVIEALQRSGIDVTQIYGLTEVYGPSVVCAPQDGWEALDPAAAAQLKSRQGVRYSAQEAVRVLDPDTMLPVPADGVTVGEVMFRGNMTMKGYLKNRAATDEAFAGGWFHSGDLAVLQPDGYLKIRDRSKDVIISGGENINSLEIEDALYRHPAVRTAAVVAQPDLKWGETPCAFVELHAGAQAGAAELGAHCRQYLAHFKVPRTILIGPIGKTSTGKIQKFRLRELAREMTGIAPETAA
jgi:fatty-acyl-CoA synthase